MSVSVPRLVPIRLTTVRRWRARLIAIALSPLVGMAAKNVRNCYALNSVGRLCNVAGLSLGTCSIMRCLSTRRFPPEANVAHGILVILVWETSSLALML